MMDNMRVFYELFDASLPRLGPGDDVSTGEALNRLLSVRSQRVDTPGRQLRILDIGCGNGAQTIQLARYTKGRIIAIDNHQPYLDELQRRAEAEGVASQIQPCLRDMHHLGPDEGSFDLIWSEGAIFVMGFREGLSAWHSLLVPDGLMTISELSWLRSNPPVECQEFFAREYPDMVDVDTNLAAISNCGYEPLEYFTVPESAWWESYYRPLENRLQSMRMQHGREPEWIELIDSVQMEIDVYRSHSSYYGYVFYLMQRR